VIVHRLNPALVCLTSATNISRRYWTLFDKGNIDGLTMYWDTTDFYVKLLKAEREVNQQMTGQEFKCYVNSYKQWGLLHTNINWLQAQDVLTRARRFAITSAKNGKFYLTFVSILQSQVWQHSHAKLKNADITLEARWHWGGAAKVIQRCWWQNFEKTREYTK